MGLAGPARRLRQIRDPGSTGLELAQLGLTLNSHNALRHRLIKGGPLASGRDIDLGTLDHDLKEIEIVRYVSPIVIVNVVSEDGQTTEECAGQGGVFCGECRNT